MTENYDPKTGRGRHAVGGYIGPRPPTDSVPIMLSRGRTLMSLASYQALGPKGLRELLPNTDIELVFTADEVREMGAAALEKLQREIDSRED